MKRYEYGAVMCVLLMMVTSVAVTAQRSRPSVSSAEVTGTYRMNFTGKFRGSYDEIQIASSGRGKLRVALDLLYPYKMQNGDDMANIGQLDETFTIDGDTATYTSTQLGQCTIKIKFVRPGSIKVTQDGNDSDCGFGHNVRSDGMYRKFSSRKPKFDTQVR